MCFHYLLSDKKIITMASAVTVEEDEYITLLVNNLPVTVRKDATAKTMLTIYCQQNGLPYPDYKISLVNPEEKEWKLFKARFKLNEREVVGSGKNIKAAEMAAARKYLSNNFMSGENSPQAEIQVTKPKKNIPPKQLRKQQQRMDRYNARKKAEDEAAKKEEKEAPKKEEKEAAKKGDVEAIEIEEKQTPGTFFNDSIKNIDPRTIVCFDLERATGSEASEIIQIGYCCKSGFGLSNIFPKGNIDMKSAKISHQIKIQGEHLVRKGEILPSMDLRKAVDEFIIFLRNIATKTGSKPILVCHGTDMTTLYNNLALIKCDGVLAESIRGAVDFLQVITDDESYPHDSSSKSLTKKKKKPEKLNLSQTILGKDYDRGEVDEAHDALYDSKLLMRVLDKYASAYSQRLDIIVDTHMKDAEYLRRSVKDHLSSPKSRKKRLDQTEFYTFFGWED